MHPILEKLCHDFTPNGHNRPKDVAQFLNLHGMHKTVEHSKAVAETARQLAPRFYVNPTKAADAGWFHDISSVIPNNERLTFARALGIDVLREEEKLPMILHQKLSRVVAREIFGIRNTAILDAVECHTTLKRRAKPLDKILFVADKLAWDQDGTPPYAHTMNQALDQSLDGAVCVYILYLWRMRDTLPVIHPWLVDAMHELCDGSCEGVDGKI